MHNNAYNYRGPDFKSALINPSRGEKEGFQLHQCLTPAEEALFVLLKDVQGISVSFRFATSMSATKPYIVYLIL